MELFLFIDESGAPSFNDPDPFLIGCFVSTKPIPPEFFHQALVDLSKDPDFNKYDNLTVERNYFHASFDSKNGHSFQCRKISSIDWPCEFYHQVFFKNEMDESFKSEMDSERKIHKHMIASVLTNFVVSKISKLNIYISERSGSFSVKDVKRLEKYFYGAMKYSAAQSPVIPVHLPATEIFVESSTNPGLQICDFILWAVRREKEMKDSTWISRSNFKKPRISITLTPIIGDDYFINKSIDFFNIVEPNSLPAYTDVDDMLKDKNGVYNGFINLELTLKNAGHMGFYPKNKNLRNQYNDAIQLINSGRSRLNNDEIGILGETYLLFADEAPLYDTGDVEKIKYAYFLKRIASIATNRHYIQWSFMCMEWRRVRQWAFENNPELWHGKK